MRLDSRYSAALVFLTMVFGIGIVVARDPSEGAEVRTVTVGESLESACAVLAKSGYNKPYGLAWAKPASDQSIQAFQIDDGIVLVFTYSDATKDLLTLQMVFTPPGLAKANDRIVELRQITFEPDGSYILHVLKQELKKVEPAALPNSQLPRFSPAK